MHVSPSKPLSHVTVWAMAGPIILSNISEPILGLVDTAVIGHLPGAEILGAVSIGALIFSFLFWSFGFLRQSSSGFSAQAVGSGNQQELSAVLYRAMLLAIILGIAMLLLQKPILWLCLSYFELEPNLYTHAADYCYARIWSAPATFLNFAILGYLVGTQRSGLILAIQLLLNISNIILDILFVSFWGWGAFGVGIASTLSNYVASIFGLIVLVRIGQAWPGWVHLLHWGRLVALFKTNINLMIRTFSMIAAMALFTKASKEFGVAILAANHILMQMQNLMAHSLDGFADTVDSLTGQAMGRKDLTGFRDAVFKTSLWATVTAGIISLAFYTFGGNLINTLTTDVETREVANSFLWWIIAMPLLSVACFQFDGIFMGTTHARELRNSMLFSLVGFYLLHLIFPPFWGVHGLWLAFAFYLFFRAACLLAYMPTVERSVKLGYVSTGT